MDFCRRGADFAAAPDFRRFGAFPVDRDFADVLILRII